MSLPPSRELPKDGYIRADTLANLFDVSRVTIWRWAKNGKFPQPIKLSHLVTVWSVEEIREWVDSKSRPTSSIQ